MLLNFIMGVCFFFLPTKSLVMYLFRRDTEEEEDGDYTKYEKILKHYDLENPVTRASGLSRLEGKSLRENIRKCILKVLIKKVEAKDEKKIEDAQTNAFGMEGLGMLISLQKKKARRDLVQAIEDNQMREANDYARPIPFVNGESTRHQPSPGESLSKIEESRPRHSSLDYASEEDNDEEEEDSDLSNKV